MAVVAGVGGVEDQRRSRRMSQQREAARGVAEPDHRACGVAARSRRRRREKQIEGPIVIQIGDMQAHFAGQDSSPGFGNSGNLGGFPALSFVLVRNPEDGAVSLHRYQIENAVVVGIGHRDALTDVRSGGSGRSLNCPWRKFMNT